MGLKRILILSFIATNLLLIQGCYYPVVLTGNDIGSIQPEDDIDSFTLKNGREMIMDRNAISIQKVFVQNDTLVIQARAEYGDRTGFQEFNQRIPVDDIQSVRIHRIDTHRSAFGAIFGGVAVVTIALVIITGDIDLLFLFLDLL